MEIKTSTINHLRFLRTTIGLSKCQYLHFHPPLLTGSYFLLEPRVRQWRQKEEEDKKVRGTAFVRTKTLVLVPYTTVNSIIMKKQWKIILNFKYHTYSSIRPRRQSNIFCRPILEGSISRLPPAPSGFLSISSSTGDSKLFQDDKLFFAETPWRIGNIQWAA